VVSEKALFPIGTRMGRYKPVEMRELLFAAKPKWNEHTPKSHRQHDRAAILPPPRLLGSLACGQPWSIFVPAKTLVRNATIVDGRRPRRPFRYFTGRRLPSARGKHPPRLPSISRLCLSFGWLGLLPRVFDAFFRRSFCPQGVPH